MHLPACSRIVVLRDLAPQGYHVLAALVDPSRQDATCGSRRLGTSRQPRRQRGCCAIWVQLYRNDEVILVLLDKTRDSATADGRYMPPTMGRLDQPITGHRQSIAIHPNRARFTNRGQSRVADLPVLLSALPTGNAAAPWAVLAWAHRLSGTAPSTTRTRLTLIVTSPR